MTSATRPSALLLILLLAFMTACGSGGSSTATDVTSGSGAGAGTGSSGGSGSGGSGGGGTGGGGSTGGTTSSAPQVVVVMLENQDYGSVLGNANMPFLNGLITQYALATNFYANVHPSLGNYFMLTAGNVISTDDQFAGTYSGDNVARELTASGKTWKIYAEALPTAGYTGDDVYPYIKHHNPFAYFDDVLNSTSQKQNMVPFSQFNGDLSNNTLPSYALVVPGNTHNGHDCPDGTNNCTLATKLTTIDNWLSANIGPLVQNTTFMKDGIVIITFDEAALDNANGGGKVVLVMAGSSIKGGFQSTTKYQFENLLKFTMDRLGVTTVPGAGAGAASMSEFLK